MSRIQPRAKDVNHPLITGSGLVSSDSHILEPSDLWLRRMDAPLRDRAPRVVGEENTDRWYADGAPFHTVNATSYQAGVRFVNPERLSLGGRFDAIPPGALAPHTYVKDMDVDGVAGAVLYPSVGLQLYRVPDSDLLSASMRAYNDYIAEFCNAYPQRLKGSALLNVDSTEEAVKELGRAARMGLVGAIIPVQARIRYDHPSYERLWAEAERLAIPLSLHGSTNRWQPDRNNSLPSLDPVAMSTREQDLGIAIAALILSGVFERYPGLKVVSVENEVSWAFYLMHRMDDVYRYRVAGLKGRRFRDSRLPSDFFRQHVFISFQEDVGGIQGRHHIGVDRLMWGADYPHAESTFPRSREIVDQIFEGVPQEEKAKITRENAVKLYRFFGAGDS